MMLTQPNERKGQHQARVVLRDGRCIIGSGESAGHVRNASDSNSGPASAELVSLTLSPGRGLEIELDCPFGSD